MAWQSHGKTTAKTQSHGKDTATTGQGHGKRHGETTAKAKRCKT
jgi:hypothetical protein